MVLIAWMIRYAYNIFDQSYYLTDTSGCSFLTFISFIAVIGFIVEMIVLANKKKILLDHWQFTLFTIIMALLLWFTFITIC